jgi:site-specific recombinase XerC
MNTSNNPEHLSLADGLRRYQEQFLASRNFAPLTRTKYLGDLTDLIRFLTDELSLARPEQVERRHLERYLAELDKRQLKGSSRRRKVSSSTRSALAKVFRLRSPLAHKPCSRQHSALTDPYPGARTKIQSW